MCVTQLTLSFTIQLLIYIYCIPHPLFNPSRRLTLDTDFYFQFHSEYLRHLEAFYYHSTDSVHVSIKEQLNQKMYLI